MVDLEKVRYPRPHRHYTDTQKTNTVNTVVALAQAGNWGFKPSLIARCCMARNISFNNTIVQMIQISTITSMASPGLNWVFIACFNDDTCWHNLRKALSYTI